MHAPLQLACDYACVNKGCAYILRVAIAYNAVTWLFKAARSPHAVQATSCSLTTFLQFTGHCYIVAMNSTVVFELLIKLAVP